MFNILWLFTLVYFANSKLYFTPAGRMHQIRAARNAVAKGTPVIAVQFSDGIGIAIATSSSLPPLQITAPQQFFRIDSHVSLALTGLLFDSLVVVDIAKQLNKQYKEKYSCSIPLRTLSSQLGKELHSISTSAKHRPVGVHCLITGWDASQGYQIHAVDMEGCVQAWKRVAIGEMDAKFLNNLELKFGSVGCTSEMKVQDGMPILMNCIGDFFNEIQYDNDSKDSQIGTTPEMPTNWRVKEPVHPLVIIHGLYLNTIRIDKIIGFASRAAAMVYSNKGFCGTLYVMCINRNIRCYCFTAPVTVRALTGFYD